MTPLIYLCVAFLMAVVVFLVDPDPDWGSAGIVFLWPVALPVMTFVALAYFTAKFIRNTFLGGAK